MNGLKNVSHRHDDALSRVGWAELERLLATYYREVGWWVEHAGTGGAGARFDGGALAHHQVGDHELGSGLVGDRHVGCSGHGINQS